LLAIRLLQESTSTTDISWLIWVVLALFLLMVLLGWWASGRLPKDDETVSLQEGEQGHDEQDKVGTQHEA
jgi:hypothetical protein